MFDDLARMATFREVGGDVVTGIVRGNIGGGTMFVVLVTDGRMFEEGIVDLVTDGTCGLPDISVHVMSWRAASMAVGGDAAVAVVGSLGAAADRSVRSVRL